MSMIDDDNELNRILEDTILDEYEIIDFPLEQLGDSSQEIRRRRIRRRNGPSMDTQSMSGLAPQVESSVELRLKVDPCQSTSLSSTHLNEIPHLF